MAKSKFISYCATGGWPAFVSAARLESQMQFCAGSVRR